MRSLTQDGLCNVGLRHQPLWSTSGSVCSTMPSAVAHPLSTPEPHTPATPPRPRPRYTRAPSRPAPGRRCRGRRADSCGPDLRPERNVATMLTTEPVCRSSGSELSNRGIERPAWKCVDHDHVARRLHAEGAGPVDLHGSCTSMSGSTTITILGRLLAVMTAKRAARASPA
jgi:hypothetical protein